MSLYNDLFATPDSTGGNVGRVWGEAYRRSKRGGAPLSHRGVRVTDYKQGLS